MHRSILIVLALSLAVSTARPALASGISYTCDPTIDAALAGTCSTLNTGIAGLYSGTFTNANASIYIAFGTTGLGQSAQYYNASTFTNYLTALTGHESGANDITAVSSLSGGEPGVFGGGNIYLTGALDAALGLSGATGISTNSGNPSCTLGTANCYNGIITLATPAILAGNGQSYYYRSGAQAGSAYDIYSVVEHETDEILGTSSCIGTSGGSPADECGVAHTGVSPADLFRYSAAATRSFVSQGNGTLAYLSINGGTTSIGAYNNTPNGEDYGDWSTNCQHVQDATACLGQSFDITTDGRVEIAALDAAGFNLTGQLATSEPGTLGMLGLGFTALGACAWRRRRDPSP